MRILLVIIFSGSLVSTISQNAVNDELIRREKMLETLFEKLYTAEGGSEKPALLDTIRILFSEALLIEGSFEYSWDRLNKMGKISSSDGMVKIFTWHYGVNKDLYTYNGFIQLINKKGEPEVFELVDNGLESNNLEQLDQSVEDWHGKLYYGIVVKEYKRNTYYTLLGMDYNNSLSTIKTVETIFLRRDKPVFARKMFLDGTKENDRLVLQYSSQVAISVRYNQALDQIVFDHLIPLHPVYTGNYEFYGPDGSYDGIEFIEGVWILRQDVDARNLY